jgi:hypothetical protein
LEEGVERDRRDELFAIENWAALAKPGRVSCRNLKGNKKGVEELWIGCRRKLGN